MNTLERKMSDRLVELRDKYHVTAVKAEFEAEGTRMEEAMRLKEISMRSGLDLTIKIGGCEALKDMFEAASLGTRYLVAPMVESAFALQKFLSAIDVAFTNGLREAMEFYVNIETITACQNFDEMLKIPEIGRLTGIVIGRHDLTMSMGLPLPETNGPRVQALSLDVAAKAKRAGLKVVVGGAVSTHSIPFFRSFPAGHLDKFETRKIVFSCPGAISNPPEAFLRAVEFEMDWLKSKKAFYGAIHREGELRLKVMEERYQKSIEALEIHR